MKTILEVTTNDAKSNVLQNFTFICEGRIVKVKCSPKELEKHKTKIENKCKELDALQSFKGEII
jgi:hypothetical protein